MSGSGPGCSGRRATGSPSDEEILGHHLEQAFRFREELGLLKDDALRLRAGERLGAAGTRALDRGDVRASVELCWNALPVWWQVIRLSSPSSID